jgi:thymidylate synthase ThyX
MSDFTPEESAILAPYFTNLDRPIFALVNLPETVKGALFARYSRSAKSLRRLFLDEFADQVGQPAEASTVGTARAEKLYQKVFSDYGDDSVAQLGGAHLACEDVSNILTKVLERGRLMAYLEQSTRYIPYTERRSSTALTAGGSPALMASWRYVVPAELDGHPLRAKFIETMNDTFETYAGWIDPMRAWFERRYPKSPTDSDGVYRSAIRAKALDTLRGLLPAATQSNVGMYGTGQAYESLLLRMRAHPLAEVREAADAMLEELRKIIPAFLIRVDQPERGGRWTAYLAETRKRLEDIAARTPLGSSRDGGAEVTLSDFDPEGEIKVVAAALYAATDAPDADLLAAARRMSVEERAGILRACAGERGNRRHKPGRAFERTAYRFDILTDYGAFRDLQRHRLLTIEWQALTTRHGYSRPEAIVEAGGEADWQRIMDRSAELHESMHAAGLTAASQYAVAMAYRIRFIMDMNAREAMHVIELRTSPQGHPAYRRVCQDMHRSIAEVAGHRAIAAAMQFVDHSVIELERLQEERRLEKKRQVAGDS